MLPKSHKMERRQCMHDFTSEISPSDSGQETPEFYSPNISTLRRLNRQLPMSEHRQFKAKPFIYNLI